MKKRNQININLDEPFNKNVQEYCRVHGMPPQEFFKLGARRLIAEDIFERNADIMTMLSMNEIAEGKHESIDDLLETLSNDEQNNESLAAQLSGKLSKVA
jgi:hypothetical protein